MQSVVQAIEKSRDRSVGILTEFLRIPSISTDRGHRDDVRRAAEFLADQFRAAGISTVEVMATGGHPVVYAEWLGAPEAPTVLVYGHYDVQPITDPSLWTSPPFEPVVREGKIWARGATDDKGQLLVHLLAAGAHLAENGRLPVNVKFLIEGEEEIGSEHLAGFVREHRQRLECDAIVVSDTAMYSPDTPSICTGLRGIAYTQFTLRGARQDLHSGSFGGVVDNPAIVLARLIAGLKDPVTGRILVEGFYDDVEEPEPEELEGWAKLPASEDRLLAMTGSPRLFGEAGRTVLERVWSRPTLDVNGIWGGFTAEGSMTVLPARASAKVSMRLVKNQSSDEAAAKLKHHIERALPDSVVLERFENLHGGEPWTCSLDHPAVRAAFAAVDKGFGSPPVPTREGGSIPIVPMLAETLEAPAVLMGFGLHDEGAHSHDEHFDLNNFQAGIRSSAHYLHELRAASAEVKRVT